MVLTIRKAKDTQMCVIKRKIKLKDYIKCLEATRLEDKISQLVKNKVDLVSLKEDHKELKKRKLILIHKKNSEMKSIMFLLSKLITLL